MNVDKRLEELAAIKGGREYVMTRVLIAALLRARKTLAVGMKELRDAAKMLRSQGKDFQSERFDNSANELEAALSDPELEKLLR